MPVSSGRRAARTPGAPTPSSRVDSTLRPPMQPTVRAFVASIRPPMPELAPVLMQGGVRDKACLAQLIAMTEAQQRALLERLPLNVFQVQIVCNALAELRRD